MVGGGCGEENGKPEEKASESLVQKEGECQGLVFMWFKEAECVGDTECGQWARENDGRLEKLGIDKGRISCCPSLEHCGYFKAELNYREIVEKTFEAAKKLGRDTGYAEECKSIAFGGSAPPDYKCSTGMEFGEKKQCSWLDYETCVSTLPTRRTGEGAIDVGSMRIRGSSLGVSSSYYEREGYEEIRVSGYKVYRKYIVLEKPTPSSSTWPVVCLDCSAGEYKKITEELALLIGGYEFKVKLYFGGRPVRIHADPVPYSCSATGTGVEYTYCIDKPELGQKIMEILIDNIIH